MMLSAQLDNKHQGQLWCEAVAMAMRLRNITPNRAVEKTPDELWYGEKLKLHDHLIQFGRIGWVKKPQYQQKLEKKAEKMVCIGYALTTQPIVIGCITRRQKGL